MQYRKITAEVYLTDEYAALLDEGRGGTIPGTISYKVEKADGEVTVHFPDMREGRGAIKE